MTDVTRTENGISARYYETSEERVLSFERDGRSAVIVQNLDGYAMLTVRDSIDGDERERYYGFDMAVDHAAELLDAAPHELPIPDAADDMGM